MRFKGNFSLISVRFARTCFSKILLSTALNKIKGNTMKQFTVALIGCGRISFKHIEGFVADKEKMTLIACCDPLLERAE